MLHRLLSIFLFAAFSLGGSSAQAPAPAAAPTRDTIHFDYDRDYLYVDASVNDSIRGRFIFDTGAAIMLLDSNLLARRARGLPPNPIRSDNSREGAKSRITIRRDGQTLEIEHTNLNGDTLWQ